jgi:hypothetical protein
VVSVPGMWRWKHVGELVKNATQTVLVVPDPVAAREKSPSIRPSDVVV